MSGAPIERLFWPTARDQQGTLWGPRFTKLTRSVANASLVAGGTGTVPWPLIGQDYIEWVQNIRVRAEPGAGQNIEKLDIGITDSSGTPIAGLKSLEQDGAADEPLSLDLQLDFPLLGDRHTVRASGIFNAGVQVNNVYLEVASIITVRGNIAVF